MRKTSRAGRRRSPRYRRLCAEPLETRQLLSITVNTLVDEADGSITDGDVSLRDAIALAPSGETIDFSVTGTILLTLGELYVYRKDLVIAGPGAALLTIDASGNDPTPDSTLDDGDDTNDGDGSRVINIDDGGQIGHPTVKLSDLTLTGGDVNGDGGAIRAHANLSLAAVTVEHNSATNDGGGIYAGSDVDTFNMEYSVVSDNSAGHDGGGIWVEARSGDSKISHSYVARNAALGIDDANSGCGGGIWVRLRGDSFRISETAIAENIANSAGGGACVGSWNSGVVTIAKSTISSNSVLKYGGGGIDTGAFQDGSIVVEMSTVSGNASGRQGGGGVLHRLGQLFIESSTITSNMTPGGNGIGGGIELAPLANGSSIAHIHSSIVSGNSIYDVAAFDGVNTGGRSYLVSDGHNLIGTSNRIEDFGETGDQTGIIDPMLGPLQDNGGPTLTHAPLPGSPVIDAGDPTILAPPYTDQRGYYRVVDGDGDMTPRIDIGAVEYGSVAPLPGDGNLDMSVDGLDYIVWAQNFFNNPPADPPGSPLNGDFDDDGVVDGLDYVLWAIHFGETVATTSAVQETDVVDVVLRVDVESTHDAAAGGSLPYQMAVADDGDVASAVDAVFAEMTMRKAPKHHRR